MLSCTKSCACPQRVDPTRDSRWLFIYARLHLMLPCRDKAFLEKKRSIRACL